MIVVPKNNCGMMDCEWSVEYVNGKWLIYIHVYAFVKHVNVEGCKLYKLSIFEMLHI